VRRIAPLALLLGGCSLLQDPANHMGGEVPVGTFCEHVASILCAAHQDCCETPAVSFADCLQGAADGCRAEYMPFIEDARVGYDEEAAAMALARGRALAGACDPAFLDWVRDRDGMQAALVGTIASGEVCVEGTVDGPELFSCIERDESCQVAVGGWRCLPQVAPGRTCYLDTDCDDAHYCDAAMPGEEGICTVRGAATTECTEARTCQSLFCNAGRCADRDPELVFCGRPVP
jgi:hypothetical protein